MRPKETFADAVAASHSSILIGELAKMLRQNGVDTGEKRLVLLDEAAGLFDTQKGDGLQYADAAKHGDDAVRGEGACHQQSRRKH